MAGIYGGRQVVARRSDRGFVTHRSDHALCGKDDERSARPIGIAVWGGYLKAWRVEWRRG